MQIHYRLILLLCASYSAQAMEVVQPTLENNATLHPYAAVGSIVALPWGISLGYTLAKIPELKESISLVLAGSNARFSTREIINTFINTLIAFFTLGSSIGMYWEIQNSLSKLENATQQPSTKNGERSISLSSKFRIGSALFATAYTLIGLYTSYGQHSMFNRAQQEGWRSGWNQGRPISSFRPFTGQSYTLGRL